MSFIYFKISLQSYQKRAHREQQVELLAGQLVCSRLVFNSTIYAYLFVEFRVTAAMNSSSKNITYLVYFAVVKLMGLL